MELIWRKAKAEDIEEVDALYHAVHDALEAGINHPKWIRNLYPARMNAEKGIEAGNLFVVEHEGKMVGSVILNHKQEQGYDQVTWMDDTSVEEAYVIHTLLSHPQLWGTGLGVRIMELVEEQARKDGMRAIRLDVYERNNPAICLYEKCGYQYLADIDMGLAYLGLESLRVYEKLLR